MLNMPIENEIEKEHKVFRDFTMRQTISLVIGAIIAVIMYLIFHDWVLMVAFTLPFALVLAYFTRKDDNGRPAEEIAMKKAEEFVYKNSKRQYRTKNGYMPLLNKAYSRMRNKDNADKAVIRERKRLEKAKKRKLKASKIKWYS